MINGSRHCSFITYINTPDACEFEQKQYKRVNNYLLAQKIGTGSSSKVYLGIDGEKKYAIKRISLTNLSRKSNGIMQLEREIRLMHIFNHSNILKIHEVLHSISNNYVYLVLEHAECGSIGSLIDKGYHFQLDSIRSIIKQISSALSYIHSKGYVHQDIKPANILLKSDGKVLLADFGIGHSFLSASTVVGTPAYQAPEAIVDNIDLDEYEYDESFHTSNKEDESYEESAKEDEECPQLREEIWALGISLYQLIFNELPYTGENLYEIVSTIKSTPLVFPYDIDPEIEKLLRKMLAVDPQNRISLEDLMNDPFVKDAPDLVPEKFDDYISSELTDNSIPLSYKSLSSEKENNIIQIDALKCGDDYSFAQVALSMQSKLLQIHAPYSPDASFRKNSMRSSSLMLLPNANNQQSLTPNLVRTPSMISRSARLSPHSVPINFSPQQSSFSLSDE